MVRWSTDLHAAGVDWSKNDTLIFFYGMQLMRRIACEAKVFERETP